MPVLTPNQVPPAPEGTKKGITFAGADEMGSPIGIVHVEPPTPGSGRGPPKLAFASPTVPAGGSHSGNGNLSSGFEASASAPSVLKHEEDHRPPKEVKVQFTAPKSSAAGGGGGAYRQTPLTRPEAYISIPESVDLESAGGKSPASMLGSRVNSGGLIGNSAPPGLHTPPPKLLNFPSTTTLDPEDLAGAKMMRIASGERLKTPQAYRKRGSSMELTITKGLPNLLRGSPTDPNKKRAVGEGEGGGKGDTGLGDDRSDASSGDGSSFVDSETSERMRKRRRSIMTLVPLWIQVCILMAVPVIFVTVYLSITFDEALGNRNFVLNVIDEVQLIVDCESALAQERAVTNRVIMARNPDELLMMTNEMTKARSMVDEICANRLQIASQNSPVDVVNTRYLSIIRGVIRDYTLLRYRVDNGLVSGSDMRSAYRVSISKVTNGISDIGKESVITHRFLQLKDLRAAANRMGMCRAIGAIVVRASASGSGVIPDDLVDFNRGCRDAFRRYFQDFVLGGDATAQAQLAVWQNDPIAQKVLQAIVVMSSFQKGMSLNQTEDGWFGNVTYTLQLLDQMSEVLLDELHASSDLYNAVVSEGTKLGVTLFVSIIGILFVSRAQNKASSRVEFALNRTRQMSRAVQAFIPRSFLKLMAVDSILHLERGDQTEVSVAMLLCDIRNFTGISEHMTNEQLFDWLQAHLTRMTRTTEKHKGFVDKFVGDAVSAIFMNPSDAVHCGVKMQTVTDALCYELIAHNEDHMVKIGVGVHYALVGVGVLGNDKHHSCSIVSAEINVAGQLEALTKHYGARIIITDRAAELLSEGAFEFRVLGRARLSLTSEREFTLYDIFQADALPMKRYKHETADVWDRLVQAQEDGRYADMKPLLAELEAAAKRHGVKDTALKTKAEAKNPFDQFDMD